MSDLFSLDPSSMMCRQTDPDLWTPSKGESPEPAKALCRRCEWIGPCLQYALEHPDTTGVWGATTGKERVRLRAGKTVSRTPANYTNEETQRDVLILIARGWRHDDIAREFGISSRTVLRIRERHEQRGAA